MSPRALLAVAVAALVVAMLLVFVGFRGVVLRPRTPLPDAAPATPEVVTTSRPPEAHFGEVCARHQLRTCDGGDVFWVDSCGRREERAERCDNRYCESGRCVLPSPGPACANLSEGGRCDGGDPALVRRGPRPRRRLRRVQPALWARQRRRAQLRQAHPLRARRVQRRPRRRVRGRLRASLQLRQIVAVRAGRKSPRPLRAPRQRRLAGARAVSGLRLSVARAR